MLNNLFSAEVLQETIAIVKGQFLLAFWETLYVTVAAMFFAVLIGLPLGVLLVVGEKDGLAPLPPESDVAGITAHNLDDAAALMGGRGITHLINRLHGRIHCGVETDGVIGTCDIQIDGSRKSYGINSKCGKLSRSAEGTVAADYHQAVNPVFLTDFSALFLALSRCEFLASGCIENRTAAVDNIRHAGTRHINNFFLQKARVSSHDALHF